MIYEVEYGSKEKAVYENFAKTGQIPPAFENPPELTPDLEFYYYAFIELGSERNVSGRLPRSSMVDYCSEYGLGPDDKEDFIYVLRNLDMRWMDYNESKRSANGNKDTQPGQTPKTERR